MRPVGRQVCEAAGANPSSLSSLSSSVPSASFSTCSKPSRFEEPQTLIRGFVFKDDIGEPRLFSQHQLPSKSHARGEKSDKRDGDAFSPARAFSIFVMVGRSVSEADVKWYVSLQYFHELPKIVATHEPQLQQQFSIVEQASCFGNVVLFFKMQEPHFLQSRACVSVGRRFLSRACGRRTTFALVRHHSSLTMRPHP